MIQTQNPCKFVPLSETRLASRPSRNCSSLDGNPTETTTHNSRANTTGELRNPRERPRKASTKPRNQASDETASVQNGAQADASAQSSDWMWPDKHSSERAGRHEKDKLAMRTKHPPSSKQDEFRSGRFSPGSLGREDLEEERPSDTQATSLVALNHRRARTGGDPERDTPDNGATARCVRVKEHDPKKLRVLLGVLSGMVSNVKYYPFDFHQKLDSIPCGSKLADLVDEDGLTILQKVVIEGRFAFIGLLFYHGSWPELAQTRVKSAAKQKQFVNLLPEEVAEKLAGQSKGPYLLTEFSYYSKVASSMSELCHACLRDAQDLDDVIAKAAAEGTLNQTDCSGFNCLAYAVAYGNLERVEQLLDRGLNPKVTNDRNETLFHVAAKLGRCHVISCLVKRCEIDPELKDHRDKRAVDLLALTGDVATMKALVDSGVTPDGQCVAIAAKQNRLELIKFLVESCSLGVSGQDERGRTGFLNAVANGHGELVRYFRSQRAALSDVDEHGRNCFHLAVANNEGDVLSFLLEEGLEEGRHSLEALLNARDKYDGREALLLVRGSDQGRPAWHYILVHRYLVHSFRQSLRTGHVDIAMHGTSLMRGFGQSPSPSEKDAMDKQLNELLKVTPPDLDMTPLHVAAFHDYTELLRLLLEAGAHPDVRDKFGLTPLHLVAMRGNLQSAKALESKGAKFDIKDKEGHLASDVAKENGQIAVENFIVGTACVRHAKTVKEKLLEAVDSISETTLETMRRQGKDIRFHLMGVLREMAVDIKIAEFDLGVGPVTQESGDADRDLGPVTSGVTSLVPALEPTQRNWGVHPTEESGSLHPT